MKKQLLGMITFVAVNAVTAVMAADLPVKAAEAAVATEQGVYVWLDGSYQQISLPRYSLGFSKVVGSGAANDFTYLGNFDSVNARAEGAGGSAGIGYLVPYGRLSPVFGTNLRVEGFASYLNARSTQHGGTTLADPNVESAIQLMNGQTVSTIQGCGICASTVSLGTNYTGWQVSGRLATDYLLGFGTLTPSAAVFGGNTRNDQTFAQSLQSLPLSVGGIPFNSTYNATTSLHWTDLGGRLGLEGRLPIHPWFTLALGGSVAWTQRRTDFVGSDVLSCGFTCPAGSTFGANATRTAFLANAEGSVIVGQMGGWKGRMFAGANWDDSVPGLSSPTWTGAIFNPTSATPVGIVYTRQTSLYAGIGLAYRWFGATP